MSRRVANVVTVILALAAAQALVLLVVLRSEPARGPAEPGDLRMQPVDLTLGSLMVTRGEGAPFDVTAARGKLLILHFWATWCVPCRTELPRLLELAGQLPDSRFRLIAVSVDDNWSAVREFFVGEVPRDVYLAAGKDYKQLGARILPATFLVTGDGRVRFRAEGARDWHSGAARRFLEDLPR